MYGISNILCGVLLLNLYLYIGGAEIIRCVNQAGQNKPGSDLKLVLEKYGQSVMNDFVPRKLESQFYFGSYQRDPFLWGFVRPNEDVGQDAIFEAIKDGWFANRADGVLEIDLSDEKYNVIGNNRDIELTKIKYLVYDQLGRCPESLIIFRHTQQQAGDHGIGITVGILDFLHDVALHAPDFSRVVPGSKAMYIFEIVVVESKTEILELLSEEHQDLGDSTISFIEHAQRIQEAINKEYFGRWQAIATRMWITWAIDLSQKSKLRIYRSIMRPLKQKFQNLGYHINFDAHQESLHCDNLSPKRKGIQPIFDYLTEGTIKSIVESCPDPDEKNLKWVAEGSDIICVNLCPKTEDIN